MGERFHEALAIDKKSSGDRFLLALLDLLKQKPYSDISISEICTKAALSRTTFYKFFCDKDALLEYLKEDLSLGYVVFKKSLNLATIPSEKVSYVHYFSFWYHVREWVDVLVRDGLWERIAMPDTKTLILLEERDWGSYLSNNQYALEMLQSFVAAGCVYLVKWWHEHNYELSPEAMASLVVYTLSGEAGNSSKI